MGAWDGEARPAWAGEILPREFYRREADEVASDLLGCVLVRWHPEGPRGRVHGEAFARGISGGGPPA